MLSLRPVDVRWSKTGREGLIVNIESILSVVASGLANFLDANQEQVGALIAAIAVAGLKAATSKLAQPKS
jgi:hypothetical protein